MNQQLSLLEPVGYPTGIHQQKRKRSAAKDDIRAGIQAKRIGQDTASAKAGSAWASTMLTALRAFCASRKADGYMTGACRITMDEFRLYAGQCFLPEPASSAAWGSLPKLAAAAGIIKSTQEYRPSCIASAHARIIRVWEVV